MMFLWIHRQIEGVDEGIVVDGTPFDGDLGFGGIEREYRGDFSVHADGNVTKHHGSISMVHISRKGLFWHVDAPTLPETLDLPCTITSEESLQSCDVHRWSVGWLPGEQPEQFGDFVLLGEDVFAIVRRTDDQPSLVALYAKRDALDRTTEGATLSFIEQGERIPALTLRPIETDPL